ncbi:MAG TPA: ABC transporter substrate-binding protein [Jatrophihabitans sp.]|jgi:polar amino acid transport system substrate-binding protein|uniref:ABC transporter substrate-binding protein n=1 Tax=Jatrophihabitans sp. TaxID=1932789 RepID=UPI002F00029E
MLVRSVATAAMSVIALLGVTACSPTDENTAGSNTTAGNNTAPSVSAAADECDKSKLSLLTPGTFTVATDNPAYEPWFSDNKPSNGKGYESAVAYAVAKKLGFEPSEVKWVTASFNSVVTPGRKNFDVDINQVSISDERKKAVDFSTGYYDVAQSVVSYTGSKIANAKSLAELKGAKLGAQVGTTSYRTITDTIKPSPKPAVYDTNDLAVQALKNKQIDGIVVDLPTGFYMSAAQLDNGKIVGQISSGSSPEQFGFVLSKGSKLTACVSKAVDALRGEGALARLEQQWLATAGGAPELK